MTGEETVERFHPTSGRIGGVVGIGLAVVIVAVGVFDRDAGYSAWIYPACGLLAVLSWSMLLRPAASIVGDDLVLRQPFSTQTVPLAAIGPVTVARVLAVRVRGKRYVSASIGRSPRQAVRDELKRPEAITDRSYGDFVERRITELVEEARRRAGDADPGEVRRTWAWPEIGAALVCLVALGITLLV